MIKRLSIDELEPGMYVCALEKPGLPEPLSFMNNILVKSREDIDGYRRAGYVAAHVDLPDEGEAPGGAPPPEGFASDEAGFPAEADTLPEAETEEPEDISGGLMGNSPEEEWQGGAEDFDLEGLMPDEEPGLDSGAPDLVEDHSVGEGPEGATGNENRDVEMSGHGADEAVSPYGGDFSVPSDDDAYVIDDQAALEFPPFEGAGPDEDPSAREEPGEGLEEPALAVVETGPEPEAATEEAGGEAAEEAPGEEFPGFPEADGAFPATEAPEGLSDEDLPPCTLMEEPDEVPEPVAGTEALDDEDPVEDPVPGPEVIEPLALDEAEEGDAEPGIRDGGPGEDEPGASAGEVLELAPEGCFDLSEGADDPDGAFEAGDLSELPGPEAGDETHAALDAAPEEATDEIIPEGPVPSDEGRKLEIVDGPAPASGKDAPEEPGPDTEGTGPIPGLEEAIGVPDVPGEPAAAPVSAGPGCVNDDYKEQFSGYKEELDEAKQVRSQAESLVRDFMSSVSRGDGIDTDRVHGTVEKMVGSIFRNQDALTSLARLKSVDDYTFAHCVNVCTLAITLGRHLGLAKEELQDLGVGALLHDVGKVLVPEEILKKPGKLTDDEFAYMQSHTELGAELLDKTEGVKGCSRDVALQHHERHDGTGYPGGLSGDDITRYGGITAVADVYDAMTSNRCYQRGMKSDEALKKLYMWRGSYFETSLVERLIRCLGIYPVGTLVELNTGEVAVVRLPNHTHPLQPLVMMVYDRSGRAYPKPFASALKEDSNRWIVSSRAPEDFGEALQDLAACV